MTTPANTSQPDTKLSVGRKCTQIKGKTIWEAQGPALEKFENEIFNDIRDLLDTHKEYLELGEGVARTYNFHLRMVGGDEERAVPTVVFTSRSKALRDNAAKLVKKHGVLDGFVGFDVMSLERVPVVATGPFEEIENQESMLGNNAAGGEG